MSTNPSHILIARNSRTPGNPSSSLSGPTETHAAASGIFRSSGSPPWLLEEVDTDDVSDISAEEDDGTIEVCEEFTKHCRYPGSVKIVAEGIAFWAHKEILFFASPFFEAALSGSWAETGGNRPESVSSIITISQPPSVPQGESINEAAPVVFAPLEPNQDSGEESEQSVIVDLDSIKSEADSSISASESEANDTNSIKTLDKQIEIKKSLDRLQNGAGPSRVASGGMRRASEGSIRQQMKMVGSPAKAAVKRRNLPHEPDAVIVLKEERASTFHDFLKFVYPHLECTITWNNVEGLMNISHKLCVPSLQQQCLTFLLTHAAGKPIKAMRIAELFEEEELYRESSRFVLDNPGGWPEHEMSTLSQVTLLKLEKRRNWFLERVLKLGLTPVAKEYQCCATCPDQATCARLVEDKWRQAYNAVFRFGPCQPSMVYRYLRTLEGVSPPLSLTHLSCQTTAKAFIATLFDRMFSIGVRGSGTETAPMIGRVPVAVPGPRRHFLYCSLKPENVPTTKRSREIL